MNYSQAIPTVLGRVMLSLIFFMSAIGNKIPKFGDTVSYMASEGVPQPQFLLVLAIIFLIAGSLSVILGYKAQTGAALLLVFLILATYFFHDFWTIEDAMKKQMEMISFMKNVALMGAMILIIANGSGPMSLDNVLTNKGANENVAS